MILCLMISLWISASEVAISSLSQTRIKKLIAQEPKISKILFEWLKSPYYLLTLILTINVTADMLISFFSAYVMIEAFNMINRNIVEAAAWLATSLVVLIIGEITPKIYARTHAERITIFSASLLSKIDKVSKPFLYPIIKLAEVLSPKSSNFSGYELSKQEAADIIAEGGDIGEIDKETSAMLKRTLNFGELCIKTIMQPIAELESINIDLKENEFIDTAVETLRSRIPVYKGAKDNIVGYIHVKDILAAWRHGKKDFAKSLIRRPTFIDEDMKINHLLKEFQRGKTHIAFIKNKRGKVEGFAALEDILEEVVGEFVDEYERI